MSAWIVEDDPRKDTPYTSTNWLKPFRRRLVAVTAQMQAGKQQMMLASWEGSIRGRWPKDEYIKLIQVQEKMIAVLSQVCDIEQMYNDSVIVYTCLQLGGALWKLDVKWRQSLLHQTKVVDPNFVRDSPFRYFQSLILLEISDVVSVFTSVSQSLHTGSPIHNVLPETLLDRLLFHHQLALTTTPDIDGRNDIGPDELQSLDHMFYASAVIAVYQLVRVRAREISNHDVDVEIMHPCVVPR